MSPALRRAMSTIPLNSGNTPMSLVVIENFARGSNCDCLGISLVPVRQQV